MASRSIEKLHPYLAIEFKYAVGKFIYNFPTHPIPFLSQTYRSVEEQDKLFEQGRNGNEGKIITNARGGQSLHNYDPSFAFDIAFMKSKTELDWDPKLFEAYAKISCANSNIEWGGNWKTFKDLPHFGFKGFTWQMARDGKQPQII